MASAAIPLNVVHSQYSHNHGTSPEIVSNSNSQYHNTTTDEQSHLIHGLNNAHRPNHLPKSIRRPSLIRTNVGQISLSAVLFLLPVALSAVLMYLIYANLESTQPTDSITESDQNRNLSDREYYVDYSATRLVFISSLSSTLALALVPVGMGLFSYMTGRSMQKASASEDLSRLPSPYQFELTLRLLGGSAMDLYRYLQYVIRGKRKRVPAVHMLHHAAFMLTVLLLLAILITIVDAFLHIATSTVQFNRNTNLVDPSFNPGRRLSDSCLDEQWSNSSFACNMSPGGSGAKGTFLNSTEAYRIMGNASANNYIRLADDGVTSVVVPVTSPSGISYTAQSFGSSTTCKTITKLCNPHYNSGGCDACQEWYYNCTVPEAGVQMSGLFNGDWSSTSSISQTFYSDSSKAQSLYPAPDTPANGQFWTSLLFELIQAEPNTTTTIDNGGIAYDANRDLISSTYGVVYGILSCNTTLSLVTYTSDVNQNIHNITTTPMNDTAGAPFIQALDKGFGNSTLENGLSIAEASAQDSVDLAYRYARLLDRTTLGLTAGTLTPDQPYSSSLLSSKQVAKVPIPEFVALIALNLILSVLGLSLCIQALLLSRKQGITDVQARLGLGAMVAGMFEDEKLNESATRVEELYAELRGWQTDRILAVDPATRGGRMFVGVAGDRIGKMDGGTGYSH